MAPRLEVWVLGVGDAFSLKNPPSAFLLVYGGFYLAIDCPDRYSALVAQFAKQNDILFSTANVNHVLLTHVHGDHMNGLEALAFQKMFFEKKRLTLALSPEVTSMLWTGRLQASMGVLWNGKTKRDLCFEDYFIPISLPWNQKTRIGPFSIHTWPTVHHVPTCALRIEAGGRIFGYSSDTSFDTRIIDFLSPAHLIVHEAGFGPVHTSYADLLTLPDSIRTKMRLIHYPDWFEAETSEIPLLHNGDILMV